MIPTGKGSGEAPSCPQCFDIIWGIGLIDVYDLSSTAEAKIAQVSIRGESFSGNGALLMGFLSRGGQTALVRGTSTLGPAGFSPLIPDPYITVYHDGNYVTSNDNWGNDARAAESASIYPPGNTLESATMFETQTVLPARCSAYTIQLQGIGYGLLELYNVNTYSPMHTVTPNNRAIASVSGVPKIGPRGACLCR
jgi:hypothetical protein